MNDFSHFEQKIGVTFTDKELLASALTHRSYLNEHRDIRRPHNERLEFLGDAVLELAVTDFLYKEFPKKPEGELTSYRAALVNTMSLAEAARDIGLEKFLLLSRGESKDTGRARQYLLANAFEAVIGAVYLDQRYEAAEKFIADNLFHRLEKIIAERRWQDAKSFFQEKAQEMAGKTPSYKTLRQTGPDHDKQFTVGVYVGDDLIAEGEGKSKQDAEQEAAENALKRQGWR